MFKPGDVVMSRNLVCIVADPPAFGGETTMVRLCAWRYKRKRSAWYEPSPGSSGALLRCELTPAGIRQQREITAEYLAWTMIHGRR